MLRRFAKIVQEHAKIKSMKFKSFSEIDFQDVLIPIDVDKINKILGIKLQEEEYLTYLKGLGFEISNKIKVPSYRHDIKTQNDLSEEIARVIGYDNIKSVPINLKEIIDDKNQSKISKLKSLLIKNGFLKLLTSHFPQKKKNNLLP